MYNKSETFLLVQNTFYEFFIFCNFHFFTQQFKINLCYIYIEFVIAEYNHVLNFWRI